MLTRPMHVQRDVLSSTGVFDDLHRRCFMRQGTAQDRPRYVSPEWTPARSRCSMMPGIEDVLAVADSVHLASRWPIEVFIHQNGMFLTHVRLMIAMILDDVLVVVGNLHALSAQNIGRAHQHRVAQLIGRLLAPRRR